MRLKMNQLPSMNYHTEELNFLESIGFTVNPLNMFALTITEAWELSQTVAEGKESLAYNIDGVVIKLNNQQITQAAGVVGKTPRASCAVKFKAEEATTFLNSITWQTGRTGRVTPVAEFDTVEIAGTAVKRATLHNFKEVSDLKLHYRDTLVIRKAGDIIPEVVQVLTNARDSSFRPIPLPSHCPSCETELIYSKSGIDLECPNVSACPAQVLGRLTYFTQRNIANIKGLSEKNLEKFIQTFGISDIYDIYKLPFDDIEKMEGFGKLSVQNLKKAIEEAKHIPDYRFLAALSIEGVGIEVAKLICSRLPEDNSTDHETE